MPWNPLKIIPKNFLGIDVGTSSIKVIELSRVGERRKLENYGEMEAGAFFEKPFRTFEKSTLTVFSQDVARAILAILNETKIQTREACFSIPDFSTFFTWFSLPPMTKEEIDQGVKYEARQHIPVPLNEVVLDWQIISGEISDDKKRAPVKILLVAVPNEIIRQYQEIATLANLKLRALEAEVFALARALVRNHKEAQLLVDIGAQSTTVSVIDKGVLKRSHSFDISGNEFTSIISKGFGLDYKSAEMLKRKHGLLPSEQNTKDSLLPLIDLILNEIEKVSFNFYQQEAKEIEKVVIAGGSALMPGLIEYFSEKLKKQVEVANPFADIFYPPILETSLKKVAPSYAIAVGAALRGLQ